MSDERVKIIRHMDGIDKSKLAVECLMYARTLLVEAKTLSMAEESDVKIEHCIRAIDSTREIEVSCQNSQAH